MYRESSVIEEKDRIAKSLGAVQDEEKIKMVLDFSITEDVRSQHTILIIGSVATSKHGRDLAWNFFKEHWNLFRHRYSVIVKLNQKRKKILCSFYDFCVMHALDVSSLCHV